MIALILLFAAVGCQDSTNSVALKAPGDWLIPSNEVFDGGPGKDGIPAISNPKFIPASQATYLSGADLVIGIKIGDEVRAYPHPILDWHEIINDQIGGVSFSITYCPLTGSGIGWERSLNGSATTFGVSGLLYNTNLIPYDRATNSNWSQMMLRCVNGPLKGTWINTHQIVETKWETWKEAYPQTQVVSTNTGYSRPYGQYPYGSYRTNDALLFPVNNEDSRLPKKERIHGIIVGDQTKVSKIEGFPSTIGTINDLFGGVPIVVVGSKTKNFAVSYERRLSDGTLLRFTPVHDALPVVMVDQEGTRWDLFGKGTEGPRAGIQLKPTRSFISYWFAWGAFYPSATIN